MTTTATEQSEGRTETATETLVVTDSVFVHDSVYVRETGDTVFLTRWRTLWRERTVHDTVIERLTDTVKRRETVEVEKAVEVPRKGGNAGWIVAGVLALLMAVKTSIKTTLKR